MLSLEHSVLAAPSERFPSMHCHRRRNCVCSSACCIPSKVERNSAHSCADGMAAISSGRCAESSPHACARLRACDGFALFASNLSSSSLTRGPESAPTSLLVARARKVCSVCASMVKSNLPTSCIARHALRGSSARRVMSTARRQCLCISQRPVV